VTTQESALVVSAHATDFGLPQSTVAEACMRVFPQVTDGLT
jgi:hypothetical protein